MKSIIVLAVSYILFTNLVYSQINQEWVARYNNENNSDDRFSSMITDYNGNIYVTGNSMDPNLAYRITTLKYNKFGQLKWIANYLPYGTSYDIATDSHGNVYVTGESQVNSIDIITIKYDSLGNHKWTKLFTSPGQNTDNGFKIKIIDNLIYIAGHYAASTNGWGNVLLNYDTSGTLKWSSILINEINYESLCDMKISKTSKNIYLTGTTHINENGNYHYKIITIKTNAQGNVLWKNIFDTLGFGSEGYAVEIDSNDNAFITGRSYKSYSMYDYHMPVLKIDSSGSVQWYRLSNGQTDIGESGNAIKCDQTGNIITTGQGNNFKLLTLKFSKSGDMIFERSYPNSDSGYSGYHAGYDIDVDSLNNIYVVGQTDVGSKSGLITLKYSPLGNILWSNYYSPTYNGINFGLKIIVIGVDEVFSGGYGSRLVGSYDVYDYILIKYSNSIGINSHFGEIPGKYILNQNYPNPFNPSTNIKYQLAKICYVSLRIYDDNGREIETLVNGELLPGSYNVNWNASKYPSGVYFYRLTTDGFSETKKMLLVK